MTDLDAFLPNIRPYAPGVADPTAYFAIRQAAIEFCERTKLWRFADEFMVSDATEPLVAPVGSVVHDIEVTLFNGAELAAKTPAWLDEHCAGWRAGALTGQPAYVTQTEPNTITLVPWQAGTVNLSLWLKPAQNADELPDFIADQYRQVIANGALSYILVIPNQSFTNPDMGNAFGGAFQQKLDTLSNKGSTGQQRARARTRASFF